MLVRISLIESESRVSEERPVPQAVSLDSCYVRLIESYGLTKREFDVLKLIVSGASTNSIAQSLFVSVSTVRTHIGNLFQKLNVHIAKLMSINQCNDN